MTVLITLTAAGSDSGPFNLYSNIDGFITPFATNISKSVLLAGYTSTLVPNFTSTIQVRSTGACTNFVNLIISGITTTTTTTVASIAIINISNNSQDIVINVDSIQVNNVVVTRTGGPNPLPSGNTGTATTTQLGTHIIYIPGDSSIFNQSITLIDSNGTPQCQPAGEGVQNWTFSGVVIDGITPIEITASGGACN